MSSKTAKILVIAFLLVSANSEVDSAERSSALQIYLPREVTISDDAPKLGQIGIIRGKDSLVAKASEIALGRISVPGQEIVIDRTTVLSRLASNGITASKVTLTGAEKVTVKQRQQIIKGAEFIERASSFLGENLANDSICQWEPVRVPADLVVQEISKDIELSPRLVASRARNQVKVQIIALAAGREIGVREVTFRLKYNRHRTITRVEVDAGKSLNPENIKIEKTLSDYPEPSGWKPPYGLVAKRRLPANTVIRSNMVGPVEPPIIIKRNQNVVIRIERAGLLVTAIGKAMQHARAGEYIKVRNMDSRRIIIAKVNGNGTVEPVF